MVATSTRANLPAKLALAATSLLLSAGAVELAGRLMPQERFPKGFVLDRGLGWALPPGQTTVWRGQEIEVNTMGLRGDEPTDDPEALKILILGDSSVFGHDVPANATLDTLLEGELGALGPVEVQNGGVPGYTCRQALTLSRRVRELWSPDLLLIYSLHSDARRAHERDLLFLGTGTGPLAHTGLARLTTHAALWLRSRTGSARTSLTDYRTCLAAMTADQRQYGGRAVFVTPISRTNLDDQAPAPDDLLVGPAPYEDAMAAVAAETDSPHIDLPAAVGSICPDCGEALLMDEVHPTANGLAIMASVIAREIDDGGLLTRAD